MRWIHQALRWQHFGLNIAPKWHICAMNCKKVTNKLSTCTEQVSIDTSEKCQPKNEDISTEYVHSVEGKCNQESLVTA